MAYQCLHNLGGPPSEWLRVMRGIAGIRQTNFFNCKSVPRRVKRAELAHERTAANTIYKSNKAISNLGRLVAIKSAKNSVKVQ